MPAMRPANECDTCMHLPCLLLMWLELLAYACMHACGLHGCCFACARSCCAILTLSPSGELHSYSGYP